MDDGGITWVWGRDDLGQLGMEFSGVREGKKVCIFAPNPNPQVPTISLTISKTNVSSQASTRCFLIRNAF